VNWLDLTLALVMLLSVIGGVRKGLSREIIGLIASLLALILAAWFYHSAGSRLEPYVSSQWLASIGGFLLIFLGVLILGAVLSSVVGSILKTVGLSPIDRLLGAVFGLARGLLFSFGAVALLIAFLPSQKPGELPTAVLQSRMAPYLIELSQVIAPLAPKNLKDSFEQRYRQVKSTWAKKAES